MIRQSVAFAGVTLLLALGLGCASRAPGLGYETDVRCLEAWADPEFAHADSVFVRDPRAAIPLYEALRERFPLCALLSSRLGDAALITGNVDRAYGEYDSAIKSDQCEIAALTGRTLLDLVGHTTLARREQVLTQINAEGTCTGGEVLRHVSWRMNLVAGQVDRATRDLLSLDAGGVYGEAARAYGRDLMNTVPEGGVFVTSSPVEADLALLAEPGVWTPLGRTVIDATLLNHPEYVAHLQGLGLPLGMSADDVARLVPYSDEGAGRLITVREQVLRDLIGTPGGAAGRPAIALSRGLSDAWLMRQSERLTGIGLVVAVDAPPGRITLERRVATVMGYSGRALKTFKPLRFPGGSAYLAADVHLTLSRYLDVAEEAGISANRAGDAKAAQNLAERGLKWAKWFGVTKHDEVFRSLIPKPES